MSNEEVINQAIKELKESDKLYKQFKDFSFLSHFDWGDSEFQKIRYLLLRCDAFEKHTDHALRLSKTGLEIVENKKTWGQYKKSLSPKTDYAKWAGIGIAIASLLWNIYQGVNNNKLKDDNAKLMKENSQLKNSKN